MIVSGAAKYFYRSSGPVRRGNNKAKKAIGDNALGEAIPSRYRNGLGGINIEQVQRDRLEARRQVVRAMTRSLGRMWRKH